MNVSYLNQAIQSGNQISDIWVWWIFLVIFIVGFIACIIGAFTGLGGGMIVRPVMDPVFKATISSTVIAASTSTKLVAVASQATIITNSTTSTIRYSKTNDKFNINWSIIIWISVGLLFGQIFVGQLLNSYIEGGTWMIVIQFTGLNNGREIVNLSYGIFMFLVFFLILFKDKLGKYENTQNSKTIMICIGVLIGFMSGFFGVAGGAIKIVLILMFFGTTVKQATLYSLILALISAPIKLVSSLIGINYTLTNTTNIYSSINENFYASNPASSNEVWLFMFSMITIIVFASILGSLIGVSLQNKSTDEMVKKVLLFVILFFSVKDVVFSSLSLSGIEIIKNSLPEANYLSSINDIKIYLYT